MPASNLPPFKITVDRVDYSYEVENLSFSNVDPGGYEVASFDVQSEQADYINPGARVRILDGVGTVWEGRVAEPAKAIKHGWHRTRKVGAGTTRVACEGFGSGLKDNEMSMVYVDRDLSRWTDMSTARQLSLIQTPRSLGSWQVGADPTSGKPGITQTLEGGSNWVDFTETWYDAGPNNLISTVYYDLTADSGVYAAFASYSPQVALCSDMQSGNTLASANLSTGAENAGYFTPGSTRRFARMTTFYTAAVPGPGTVGQQFTFYWHLPTVYGNHGLTRRGSDPGGLYTSDIAADAAQRAIASGAYLRLGQIDIISTYVLPHYVQYMPVQHEQIIDDMGKLSAAHYGVWESDSIFDDTPTFTFRARGTEADFFVTLADCDETDLSERLADLYSTANITYQDAAGGQFVVTVSLPNAVLDRQQITRSTTLNLGTSSAAGAQAFANFALQALFAQSRSGGSVSLPTRVRDRNGAYVPAYRVKAGIHRIRIGDIPARAGLFSSSDRDSFRISRVENSVETTSGRVQTRIEVDAGPNLLETLQARMSVANIIGGGTAG